MLGTGGISEFEALVHSSRRRAAIATAQILATLHQIDKIILAAPESERAYWDAHSDFGLLSGRLQWDFDSPEVEFHFGKRIGELVRRLDLERLLYIGAGSMPLLSRNQMTEVVGQLSRAGERWAITNNFHSSDWLGMTDATVLPEAAAQLPRDNMLGWVLKYKAGFRLRALPPSAATQLDIDTPTDLVALRSYALSWQNDFPLIRSQTGRHQPGC